MAERIKVHVVGTDSGECPACHNFEDHPKQDCRMNLYKIEVLGAVVLVTGTQLERITSLTDEQLTRFAKHFNPA